jgi:hypothetical protein
VREPDCGSGGLLAGGLLFQSKYHPISPNISFALRRRCGCKRGVGANAVQAGLLLGGGVALELAMQ